MLRARAVPFCCVMAVKKSTRLRWSAGVSSAVMPTSSSTRWGAVDNLHYVTTISSGSYDTRLYMMWHIDGTCRTELYVNVRRCFVVQYLVMICATSTMLHLGYTKVTRRIHYM